MYIYIHAYIYIFFFKYEDNKILTVMHSPFVISPRQVLKNKSLDNAEFLDSETERFPTKFLEISTRTSETIPGSSISLPKLPNSCL